MILKPILFNTSMVQAILEGRKTSTRRIIKNKYENSNIEWFENKYGRKLVYMQNDAKVTKNSDGSENRQLRACEEIRPPYKVEDILYVRETWCQSTEIEPNYGKQEYHYKASPDDFIRQAPEGFIKWKPSIHMPKVAARIFLKVTDIKVQRLQDITEDEAQQEGIDPEVAIEYSNWRPTFYDPDSGGEPNYREAFKDLWDKLYKKKGYGWDSNPWVFVISFRRVDKEE